jgi:copper chaperone CopZ
MTRTALNAACCGLALAGLLLSAAPAGAEYLHIEFRVYGLDCDLCARGASASIQRMDGVKSVDVSIKTGTLDITLTPGNALKMADLRKRIKDNGFRPVDATVKALGRFNGQKFEVAGTGESYDARPASTDTGLVERTFSVK